MTRFRGRIVPRFVALTKPYLNSEEKWIARGLLGLLVLLMLANTAASVLLNTQAGEFSSALAARDSERYWRSIYYTIGLVIIAVPIYGFYYYVRDKLTIQWRRWMTKDFLTKYFSNRSFYRLAFSPQIDNPDQRISEDINSFTTKSIYFLLLFIETFLQLIAFSGVLWTISKTLVFVLIVYSVIGTFVTAYFFGRPLVGLNFFQLRREADFRFSLVRVRENAESIAFYRGENEESNYVRARFQEIYSNFNRLINCQLFLNLFQYAFTTASLIIPGVVLASGVMAGDLEIGAVVQATGAFATVFSALTLVVNKFDQLSLFTAGVSRLDRFAASLDSVRTIDKEAEDRSRIETTESHHLAFENLTLHTPDFRRKLITNLSISIKTGDGLLIVGASGGGKSSLLRAFAGLWDSGSGTVVRPGLDDIFFLPQRPYMIIGSLRAQLMYPANRREVSDEELQQTLVEVNLPNLSERCDGFDTEADWSKVLSLGEQQRLAIARVLLARSSFVILDEATSALDDKNEAQLYELLHQSGATLISVSHRPQVARFHSFVLKLTSEDVWELQAATDFLTDLESEKSTVNAR